MRILVVEDEQRLAQNISGVLRESGYAVDVANNGEDGLFAAESAAYDLILLDLMLPGMGGLSLLRKYRAHKHGTPVLVLTAVEDKNSIVTLLNAGADDYMTKPFDLGELLARSKALIRRSQGHSSPVLTVADLEVNMADKSVRRAGRVVDLTPMEYRVLEYLALRSRAVVSKAELLEHLYDFNWEKFSNVLEVYVSGLRRKLEKGARPLIHTVRGHGYVLRD